MNQFINSLVVKDFWAYDGSLTTPPCTEGVKWHVIKQVQFLSEEQYKVLNTFGKTNRVVQPLNARTLYISDDAHWYSAGSLALALSATLAIFQ